MAPKCQTAKGQYMTHTRFLNCDAREPITYFTPLSFELYAFLSLSNSNYASQRFLPKLLRFPILRLVDFPSMYILTTIAVCWISTSLLQTFSNFFLNLSLCFLSCQDVTQFAPQSLLLFGRNEIKTALSALRVWKSLCLTLQNDTPFPVFSVMLCLC